MLEEIEARIKKILASMDEAAGSSTLRELGLTIESLCSAYQKIEAAERMRGTIDS